MARAGVRFGPGKPLPLPCKENSWPEGLLPREGATRATRRGAPALASTGGEGVAMARVGAAGQPSHSPTPATRIHGTKAGSQHCDANLCDGSSRGGVASMGSPAHWPGRLPRKHVATAVGHGPGLALGCAGSATVPSLRHAPERHHGQNMRHETRRALDTGLDGAARGRPLFPSKAAQAPALTGSPGARGLG
jgi:hypothetical protein